MQAKEADCKLVDIAISAARFITSKRHHGVSTLGPVAIIVLDVTQEETFGNWPESSLRR